MSGGSRHHNASVRLERIPNWAGLNFVQLTTTPNIEPPSFDIETPLLGVIIRGEHVATWTQGGQKYSHAGATGSFSLVSAPTRINELREHAGAEHLIVELNFDDFIRWGGSEGSLGRLPRQAGGADQAIASLVTAMNEEVRGNCESGSLYAQSLSMALLSYINRHYTSCSTEVRSNSMPYYKLQRVREFVISNLAQDISLDDLASVAGISAYHLCRSFKKTTGVSPYRFILNARIDEAKKLLLDGHVSIAEVALAVGFSSQSHFSDAFRKRTGMSPRQFRSASSAPLRLA